MRKIDCLLVVGSQSLASFYKIQKLTAVTRVTRSFFKFKYRTPRELTKLVYWVVKYFKPCQTSNAEVCKNHLTCFEY